MSSFLKLRALACAAALAVSGTAASAQSLADPIAGDPVSVTGGQVAGTILPSGVKGYLGIPFAAPPVRDLRWKAPAAPAAWKGVRYATQFPPMCPQGMRGPGQNHYFGAEPVSEDCLYLNLWAPRTARPGAKLPVVVWIYGGAFSVGSASMGWSRGDTLASKGVIYVAANYRVGALGFMAHPELTAESPNKASGDYGFLDQVAALKWVQANIAAFGGDPANVTVIGQSAGSMAISALHASPLAKGLFQRAIGMSGSVLSDEAGSMMPNVDAEKGGLALQQALGAKSIADMRALPADRIILARGARTGPSVDGYFMPKPPGEIFAAGQQNDVGLLIGYTRDEGFSQLGNATSAADYEARARRMYGAQADELLKRYPADAAWKTNAQQAGLDISLGLMTRRWASGQAAPNRKPAYTFLFSRVHPYTPGVSFIDHDPATAGAYHAGDIVYWTGNLDAFNAYRTTRNYSALDRDLTNKMSDMVVAFAKTGNPAADGITPPRYDPKDARSIEVGDTIRVIPYPRRENLDFLASLKAAPPAPPAAAPAAPAAPNLGANAGPRF